MAGSKKCKTPRSSAFDKDNAAEPIKRYFHEKIRLICILKEFVLQNEMIIKTALTALHILPNTHKQPSHGSMSHNQPTTSNSQHQLSGLSMKRAGQAAQQAKGKDKARQYQDAFNDIPVEHPQYKDVNANAHEGKGENTDVYENKDESADVCENESENSKDENGNKSEDKNRDESKNRDNGDNKEFVPSATSETDTARPEIDDKDCCCYGNNFRQAAAAKLELEFNKYIPKGFRVTNNDKDDDRANRGDRASEHGNRANYEDYADCANGADYEDDINYKGDADSEDDVPKQKIWCSKTIGPYLITYIYIGASTPRLT
ncbi:uncharacterized protein PHACADRAFT_30205 [Phanerochaete carnosa HHB-10118-sp]|uniref:Uncharacterized protein n=1 Tax=Phanerochaete carnosa (strain HHB-10118-sp) TaxID=650164 RepID=K5WRZ2_PHACS|nr:uncharacterized protein PHACADRAFT_30205 [Phanerochaete carnosa HHB-10118-sp]EKM53162.1 hypothetical protein PHACADRAFT_30205 [Phanerochaete carnosa HHB-10118-sp]